MLNKGIKNFLAVNNLNIDLSAARFYLTMPSCEQRKFAEMKYGEKTIIRERDWV